jgi:hypothetical protein
MAYSGTTPDKSLITALRNIGVYRRQIYLVANPCFVTRETYDDIIACT